MTVTAVHPRVCGEHQLKQQQEVIGTGSSPRLRGTPLKGPGCCDLRRFIPASAGNTSDIRKRIRRVPVHPRVCGEHLFFCPQNILLRWFIPASAGNTVPLLLRLAISSVHPRVCGEHGRGAVKFPEHDGSSPRLRGTQFKRYCCNITNRFIPASAGNTKYLSG